MENTEGLVEISAKKYEALCRSSQRLDTLTDYIMDRVSDNYDYASLGIIACIAGISKEYHDAYIAEKKKEKEKEKEKEDEQ